MNKFVIWLMGDKLGSILFLSWRWLWSLPLDETKAGGNTPSIEEIATADLAAIESAQTSIKLMEARVKQLQITATKLEEISNDLQQKYAAYDRYHQNLQRDNGKSQLGEHVPAKLVEVELNAVGITLVQMAERVKVAKERTESVQIILMKEWQMLNNFQMEIQNLRGLAMMNKTLGQMDGVDRSGSIESIADKFKAAQFAMEDRYHEIQAIANLNE
jgi:phage shock protein A